MDRVLSDSYGKHCFKEKSVGAHIEINAVSKETEKNMQAITIETITYPRVGHTPINNVTVTTLRKANIAEPI